MTHLLGAVVCWLRGHAWRDSYTKAPVADVEEYVGSCECVRCDKQAPDWRDWI